ncbi:MAG: type II secretion system protein PulP [Geobacteraceae bacterium]|nr:type II secretion system protein PulP [Geobacteraceae bacterium]
MNRQRLILFILVIVLVCAVIWSYNAIPRLKTVAESKQPTVQQAKAVVVKPKATLDETVDSRVLKIGLLEQERTGFKGYRRNIFKPVFADELKLLKQKAVAVKPPQLPPPPATQAVATVPVVARPETAPLARFTFLGFLKKDAQKTIFLAKDKEIILVKKGDKIAGRYEASSITDQALTLLVADSGDEIVIPLIENRPLGAPK